jgi:hypothetical protein
MRDDDFEIVVVPPTTYEVSVPLVISVRERAVVGAHIDSEGFGGFFSTSEEALGVWNPDTGNWGSDDQYEIAKAAWTYVRQHIKEEA